MAIKRVRLQEINLRISCWLLQNNHTPRNTNDLNSIGFVGAKQLFRDQLSRRWQIAVSIQHLLAGEYSQEARIHGNCSNLLNIISEIQRTEWKIWRRLDLILNSIPFPICLALCTILLLALILGRVGISCSYLWLNANLTQRFPFPCNINSVSHC